MTLQFCLLTPLSTWLGAWLGGMHAARGWDMVTHQDRADCKRLPHLASPVHERSHSRAVKATSVTSNPSLLRPSPLAKEHVSLLPIFSE